MTRLISDDARTLTAAGWLSLCDIAFVEAVLARSRVQVLEEGDPLFHPGDASTGLFGVLSGSVAVSVVVPEFGPSMAHLMLSGTWFGETAFVRRPRVIGVHATRDSRLLFLAAREIDALVAEDPRRWSSFALLAVLNGQLAMGMAYDLMLRDPQQRCAATLLRLAALRHAPPRPIAPVALDITQSDLAHMTNLSRNSVGAVLRMLRDRGCVDVDYGQICITDPAGLMAMLAREG